ncbi:glycosyltransferase family 4 protein [Paenibacillus barcinonensis]|uniref:glycosyltransferase family 4 protein n=1 Tax=Paenibacillus TaxID=44249 RepID=UPI001C127750|nr:MULTISPECIES: glycosyltransferase family 4 protein [Paenibacillus]MBU5353645.1 glycosyltransferase family 4 protein [Paenibacillus barcinonensis]MDM5279382.1 glycosyltransferase family 4 protein [Paenibacillus silvae]
MRICIVTHRVVTGEGQGKVNYEIAIEALRQGHEVVMISNEVEPELLEYKGASWIKVFPSLKLPRLLRYQIFAFQSAAHIRKLRKTKQVDLVMVNGFITWARGDINAVHFVHSTWIKSPVHSFRVHRSWKRWYFGLYTLVNAYLERFAFRRSGKIIAVSEKVKKELIQLGIEPAKVQVIHNGVDVHEFHPRDAALKTRMGVASGRVVGLFAGDISSPRKNLDTVLKSMCSVPEIELVVAGSTDRSIYPQMVKELNIEDRVHFLGFRKDMGELMRNVDLFIFPSRYEACSLVVLEALASGIPVVITEQSGVTEMIAAVQGEHQAGYIMQNSDDAAELSNILARFVQAPDELKRMGEMAREVALNNTWTNMSQKYLHYYEEVIRHDGRLGRGRNVSSSVEVQ